MSMFFYFFRVKANINENLAQFSSPRPPPQQHVPPFRKPALPRSESLAFQDQRPTSLPKPPSSPACPALSSPTRSAAQTHKVVTFLKTFFPWDFDPPAPPWSSLVSLPRLSKPCSPRDAHLPGTSSVQSEGPA